MLLKKYLEEKNYESGGIRMMAIANGNYVYGIEVRFPATLYESDKDAFTAMVNVLNRRSGGVLKVVSTWEEFHSGIISFRVAFCNHAYTDKQVMECMELLLRDIFPSFSK